MTASIKEPTTHYTQLVCCQTGEVLGQITGPSGLADYCTTHVWNVLPGQKVVVAETSKVAQPFKFFRPVAKEATIKIYTGIHDDEQPLNIAPVWSDLAFKLDQPGMSIVDIAGSTWSAFTEHGEWVGTSEY